MRSDLRSFASAWSTALASPSLPLRNANALCAASPVVAAMLLDGNGVSEEQFSALLEALTIAIPVQVTINVFFGIDLTNVRNTGVAFGAFAGGGALVSLLTIGALTLLIVYFALPTTPGAGTAPATPRIR